MAQQTARTTAEEQEQQDQVKDAIAVTFHPWSKSIKDPLKLQPERLMKLNCGNA